MQITEHETTTGTTKVRTLPGSGFMEIYRDGCGSILTYEPQCGALRDDSRYLGEGWVRDTATDLILSHVLLTRPADVLSVYAALRPRPPSVNESLALTTWAPFEVRGVVGMEGAIALGNSGVVMHSGDWIGFGGTANFRPTVDVYFFDSAAGRYLATGENACADPRCSECGGTGIYVGLTVIEPCSTCCA